MNDILGVVGSWCGWGLWVRVPTSVCVYAKHIVEVA